MKKIAMLCLTAIVFIGISSCEEPPKKKDQEHKKIERQYKDRYKGREDRSHQKKRW